MPRDNRGGARNGKAGASYPNRTDLNGAPKALPITAAPGQPYGEAGAQRASQAITPMASGPIAPSSPVAPNTPPALAGAAPGSLPDIFAPHNGPQQFNGGQPVAPTAAPMPSQPTIAALGLLKTLPENLLSPQNKMIIQYLEASAANGATY